MKIATILSTKGGPGKTTVTANLGAFCADANIRTLLIDLDTQPSLSSFYRLEHEAPFGTYQLISQNETIPDLVISRTCIPNLSLILSNDPHNQLRNMLLYAADGRLRPGRWRYRDPCRQDASGRAVHHPGHSTGQARRRRR